jgi:hypothetical protein
MNKKVPPDTPQQSSSPPSDCEEPPAPSSFAPPSSSSLSAWSPHRRTRQTHLPEPSGVVRLPIALFAISVALLSYPSPLSQARCC